MTMHIYIGILFRPFGRDLTPVLGVHLNFTQMRKGPHFLEHVFLKLCWNHDSDHTRYHDSWIQNVALVEAMWSLICVTENLR
jgi:hypothetical protein